MSKAIIHVKNFLSEELCEEVLKLETYGEAEYLGDNKEFGIDLPKTLFNAINDQFLNILSVALNNRRGGTPCVTELYEFSCARLISTPEMVTYHYDPVEKHGEDYVHDYTRHFVSLIYLTQFEMGEILFPQHGKSVKPNQGDLVLFPTGPFYGHRTNLSIGERTLLRLNYDYTGDNYGQSRKN